MSGWLQSPRLHMLLLLVFSLLIFLGRQQDRGLPSYDDAYYGVKAREMLTAENPFVVTYAGRPSYDNPPFHFWIVSLLYRLFGVCDFATVLASGLFAAASVLLTRQLAIWLTGNAMIGLLAGAILLLPGFFQDYARRGMMDQTLTFLVLAAMCALWLADRRPVWYLTFGLATGLAVLTKSVLGAFPLAISALYLLATRRPARLRHPLWLAGVLVSLLPVSIWFWSNFAAGGGDFLDTHFGWLLLERAVVDAGEDTRWFFLGYLELLARNFEPWLPFAIWGGGILLVESIRGKGKGRRGALLIAWPLVIVGSMSLTRNQFLRYVLPAYPALAIAAAIPLQNLLARREKESHAVLVLLALLAMNAGIVNLSPWTFGAPGLGRHSEDVRALAPWVELNTPLGRELLNYRLPTWVPRNALLFYSERYLGDPVLEPATVRSRLRIEPALGLIARPADYAVLVDSLPGALTIVKQEGNLLYATAAGRRGELRHP